MPGRASAPRSPARPPRWQPAHAADLECRRSAKPLLQRGQRARLKRLKRSEQVHGERHRGLFTEIGYPRSRPRRNRQEIPSEITVEIMVELLALLGPDLGEEGEAILRRVARGRSVMAWPGGGGAIHRPGARGYRRGFLAEMTEAYYLDDEEDGSGFHEDGIRDHHARSFGVTPLAAWYRGPFMALFQSDFRNGVAVLNRMLNHAALARARTLAGHRRTTGS